MTWCFFGFHKWKEWRVAYRQLDDGKTLLYFERRCEACKIFQFDKTEIINDR